jgi:small-conductance mechanosensitive channel
MAIADLLLDAESLFQDMSFYLNKVTIALVIILFGLVIGKILEGMLRRLFSRIELDERLTKVFGARRNYARAIRRSIVRIIYVVTVIIALGTLSVLSEVFTLLLLLIVFVVLVSWVLAGIEVVPNFLARGALTRKGIRVGDEIVVMHSTGVIQGRVLDLTLTDVRLKRKNGDIFFIPNALFLRQAIVRKTHQ